MNNTLTAGLNLIPNEIEGYRIKPDYYNWTLVSLKRHGISSKYAGTLYETPIGYYKSIPVALSNLLNLEARLEAERTGKLAGLEESKEAAEHRLIAAFERAEKSVLKAALALEADLVAAGVTLSSLSKLAFDSDTAHND